MQVMRFVIVVCLYVVLQSKTFAQLQVGATDTLVVDTDSIAQVHFDYVPDFTGSEVRARLEATTNKIELTYNTHVFSFIDFLTVRNREYARMVLRRQSLFMPIFEKYLLQYGLPDELKYLSIVESGLNPKALSRSGALGLWQFIPSTGKYLGLRIDSHFDERMNVEKSTEAACKYLGSLYRTFGDWQLALAAYNCGPGAVSRAMKRSGKRDFWKLYPNLPQETRSYVPQFIAVTYLMNFHREHNLYPAYYEYPMTYDTVAVSQYLNLEAFCKQLGICNEDVMALNPEIKRNYIPNSEEGFVLKYPSDKSGLFRQNRQAILDSASISVGEVTELNKRLANVAEVPSTNTAGTAKLYHKVKRGQTLTAVAGKYHVSVAELKKWNNLRGRKLAVGQRLVIWKKEVHKTKTHESIRYPAPRKKYYQVKQGDTIWSICRKYDGASVDEIKRLNNIRDNDIRVGQRLLIPN